MVLFLSSMYRVTRSMTRKKKEEEALQKEKDIVDTVEEAVQKSRESLTDFVERVNPDEKPTMIPDDFDDFDEAWERQDKWELGEGSDWEDMNEEDEKDKAIEDAIIDDLAGMTKLRF